MDDLGEYTLTTADVCERYGVSECTVYRWKAKGRISGVKIGRSTYYRPQDVEAVAKPFEARWHWPVYTAVEEAAAGIEAAQDQGGEEAVRSWLGSNTDGGTIDAGTDDRTGLEVVVTIDAGAGEVVGTCGRRTAVVRLKGPAAASVRSCSYLPPAQGDGTGEGDRRGEAD